MTYEALQTKYAKGNEGEPQIDSNWLDICRAPAILAQIPSIQHFLGRTARSHPKSGEQDKTGFDLGPAAFAACYRLSIARLPLFAQARLTPLAIR